MSLHVYVRRRSAAQICCVLAPGMFGKAVTSYLNISGHTARLLVMRRDAR